MKFVDLSKMYTFTVNEERIPWSPEACPREQKQVPLASKRGCYVSLWSSFEPYGEVWQQGGTVVFTFHASKVQAGLSAKYMSSSFLLSIP